MAALLFSASIAYSQGVKVSRSETYQDIIAKAQNLALQKDRQQAMNILSNAISKETPKNIANVELKKSLNELATVFFSDKTQQLYEVAITLKRTDLSQSLQKIAEAQRIEPDNILLALEQARLLIAKADCSGAEEITIKQRSINPHFEEMNLVHSQAAYCLSKLPVFAKGAEVIDMKRSALSKFWMILEAEKQIKDKNMLKAAETLNALKKIDPQYPEIDYWLWKIDQLNKKKSPALAEKYVMTCKNISAYLYRQYMMDPMLCRHKAEMEISGNE